LHVQAGRRRDGDGVGRLLLRADVGDDAAHRPGAAGLAEPRDGDRRVVEAGDEVLAVAGVAAGAAAEAAGEGGGDQLDLGRVVAVVAEELEVVLLAELVHQPGVQRGGRVHLARAVVVRRRRRPRVGRHGRPVVVQLGRRRHDRRPDRRRAPRRVPRPDGGRRPGHVRAGHGRPRHEVELRRLLLAGRERRRRDP
ncbi:Os09g0482681, partial [Oryza sativa Japonica Group]